MRGLRLPAWVDAVFLLILGCYTFAGMPFTPFHGDEAMQIYAASDYFTLLSAPERLMSSPPYRVDSDEHLRILNGSINRYAVGSVLQLAGYTRDDLPPRPGWQWAFSYDDNAAQGYLPSEPLLNIARVPSTALHIASIVMIFILARAVGGRSVAYAAALIFALHPALLLNGRRALQESAMLCFGLLALWCAARITARFDARLSIRTALRWALLALACGLTLASKHSGIVFVAAALGWVFVGGMISIQKATAETPRVQSIHLLSVRLCASIAVVLALALSVFIALSPALWNDPLARLGDLIAVRSELLESQVRAAGEASSMTSRVSALVTQPFLTPVQFYEAPTFDVEPIHQSIAAYLNTRFAGVHDAPILGAALTLLAMLGIIVPIMRPSLSVLSPAHRWGLLLTLGIIGTSLLANPLPWQRYYLPLTTLMCLYAALGLQTFMRALGAFAPQFRA